MEIVTSRRSYFPYLYRLITRNIHVAFIYLFIYLFIIRFNLKFEINPVNVSRRRRKKSGIGNAPRKNQVIDASFPSIDRNCDSRVISFIFIVSSLENCIRNIHVAFIYLFSYYSFQFKIWDLHVLIIGQVRRRRRRRITEIRILEFLLLEEGRDLARLLDQTGWQNRSLSLWRKRERLKFPAAHSSEQ